MCWSTELKKHEIPIIAKEDVIGYKFVSEDYRSFWHSIFLWELNKINPKIEIEIVGLEMVGLRERAGFW